MTDAELTAALRDCYYLQRDVVSLNLIRSAALIEDTGAPGLHPRYVATITLTAPTADEAVNAQLLAQIENRLLGLQPISRVSITLLPALFPILQPR